MKPLFALLALGLLTAATNSIVSNDCIKGVGEVVKKPLTVDDFHGIVLEGSMDVVLTQSATRSVEVEAQANLIDLVETKVKNGVWTISTSDGYSTNKAFIVHISAPVIDQVRIEGSGDVTTNGSFTADDMALAIDGSGNLTFDLSAKTTHADIAGSGDMMLSGTCTDLNVQVAGSGDVNAKSLKSSNASVDIAGSGDVTLDASQSLEASIAGSGDVNYRGRPPHVSSNVAGSGDVHALDAGPR